MVVHCGLQSGGHAAGTGCSSASFQVPHGCWERPGPSPGGRCWSGPGSTDVKLRGGGGLLSADTLVNACYLDCWSFWWGLGGQLLQTKADVWGVYCFCVLGVRSVGASVWWREGRALRFGNVGWRYENSGVRWVQILLSASRKLLLFDL